MLYFMHVTVFVLLRASWRQLLFISSSYDDDKRLITQIY